MNKNAVKIKELIHNEVCMGTFGLVELELLEIEKQKDNDFKNFAHFVSKLIAIYSSDELIEMYNK